MRLRLLAISFDAVGFEADFGDGYRRDVHVKVGSGRTWSGAVWFPNLANADGETLGDEGLDQQVRERAAEELVRLEAAANLASGRWAA